MSELALVHNGVEIYHAHNKRGELMNYLYTVDCTESFDVRELSSWSDYEELSIFKRIRCALVDAIDSGEIRGGV